MLSLPPHPAHHSSLFETNSPIKGTYLARLTATKAGPDVHLSTTNGSVTAALYLSGNLPRPAEIEVTSTNGRIVLAVPAREVPIRVRTRTTNGSLTVSLPRDFDGLVSLRTTHGSKKLSPGMEGAVIFPNEPGDDVKTITYRVRPQAQDKSKATVDSKDDTTANKEQQEFTRLHKAAAPAPAHDEWDDDAGPDRAHLSTTNGSVLARYEYEEEEKKEKGEGSCRLM